MTSETATRTSTAVSNDCPGQPLLHRDHIMQHFRPVCKWHRTRTTATGDDHHCSTPSRPRPRTTASVETNGLVKCAPGNWARQCSTMRFWRAPWTVSLSLQELVRSTKPCRSCDAWHGVRGKSRVTQKKPQPRHKSVVRSFLRSSNRWLPRWKKLPGRQRLALPSTKNERCILCVHLRPVAFAGGGKAYSGQRHDRMAVPPITRTQCLVIPKIYLQFVDFTITHRTESSQLLYERGHYNKSALNLKKWKVLYLLIFTARFPIIGFPSYKEGMTVGNDFHGQSVPHLPKTFREKKKVFLLFNKKYIGKFCIIINYS